MDFDEFVSAHRNRQTLNLAPNVGLYLQHSRKSYPRQNSSTGLLMNIAFNYTALINGLYLLDVSFTVE